MVCAAGSRSLPAGEQRRPRLGRGSLLCAGDRLHAVPATVPAANRPRPGQARPRGPDFGARAGRHRLPRLVTNRGLNYPLAPLRCDPHPPLPNVLLVVIDAMRADAVVPAVAPRTAALAQ